MSFKSIDKATIQSGQPGIGPGGFGEDVIDDLNFLNGQIGSLEAQTILNGSFEVEEEATGIPANWDRTLFTAGAGVFETTAPMHGEKGYKFTHPGGGGNGGGSLQSDYFAIGQLRPLLLEWLHYVSAAGMHETVEVAYFTGAKVSISTQTIYNSTSNPTSATHYLLPLVIPATARFLKVKVIGGDDDVDVAGDSFWDGIRIVFGVMTQAEIGAGIVGQAELKTSQAEVSRLAGTSSVNTGLETLPGGEYGFFPRAKKVTAGGGVGTARWNGPEDAGTSSYVTVITLYAEEAGGGTSVAIFVNQRYVTASGEIHWLFFLRNKTTKEITRGWFSPDHPCFGNTDPEKMQHPFIDYDPDTSEVIVVQAEGYTDQAGKVQYPEWLQAIMREARASGSSPLQVLHEDYEVDEDSRPEWSDKPVTIGFEETFDEVMDLYHRGGKATLRKAVMTKADSMLHRSLKKIV